TLLDTPVGGIFERLAVDDIRNAADVLRPVYERTHKRDGYISMEVSPSFANDTPASLEEARRLWGEVNRPNLMIKIPATPAGMPAIKQLIGEGMNVNVTLIFAIEAYRQVMEAYISGLEHRSGDLSQIASVASFFVSRVDSNVDRRLEQIQREKPDLAGRAKALMGRAAIANARLAYQAFLETFVAGPGRSRFEALERRGAKVQRPLWASTGTKNPQYSDVLYVEELIGRDTVNTMPPQTVAAFKDHGEVEATVDQDPEGAGRTIEQLKELGIDMREVTAELLDEGVKLFADAFSTLMQVIEAKREALQDGLAERQQASLGPLGQAVDNRLQAIAKTDGVRKIWQKDPAFWGKQNDADATKSIKNRLGWLSVSDQMLEQVQDLESFAADVKSAGFRHAVLCGMGGSSLCVEVSRQTYGSRPGYPEMIVLDTTDPATIAAASKDIDPARTLFIIATKSGGTTETLSHFKYFWNIRPDGSNFIAITDPGTSLEKLAADHGFRRVFLNPSDIGGRYSVLSYFGLVPAAVMGVDVKKLLDRAEHLAHDCVPLMQPADNAGAWWGTVMGEAGAAGRDKVTILCPPAIASFGLWAEQLIAESTGKEGRGLVPVAGEPVGPPAVYGNDRLFAYLKLGQHPDLDAGAEALRRAGHPVVTFTLRDTYDLGEEFFRWEFGTGVAGAVLGINAFDEPNVQESKDNTKALLTQYEASGALPALQSAGGSLASLLSKVQPGDYVATMAYLRATPEVDDMLKSIRVAIRDRWRVATTVGYGPRFLHSTGQLHKGGANNGVFIQITADDPVDVEIPGEKYTFGTLKRAQALGDFQSLERHGRRAVRLHLGPDVKAGLEHILREVS
ncbi:MAG: bifunctional transaldolase/phosoglucose isomerase, partial [Chloroflexota bacterium]